ncbi:MAG: SDR family NAD(P)-dependent oxidoreductase [Gemmatimonadota bacterium]
MMGSFNGKVAVITGVGRKGQVGEAVASRFVELGARVVLVNRESDVNDRARELVASGGEVLALETDLSDSGSAARAAAAASEFGGGRVDSLVCLAGGFAMAGPVADTSDLDWHRQFTINLTTAFVTTRAFLPMVRSASGSIVYFASAAALSGSRVAGTAAYAAAKSGVVALMRAVAQEEGPSGVRANALAPTAIRTAANIESMGDRTKYVEREEIAGWVTFLSSPPSAALNGQVIRLAGGGT